MYTPKYRRFTETGLFTRKLAANFRAKKYKEEKYKILIYRIYPDQMDKRLEWKDNFSIDIIFGRPKADVLLRYYNNNDEEIEEEFLFEKAIPRIKRILENEGYIFEEKARKEGLVKTYHDNGKLKSEGFNKNGVKEEK